MVGWSALLLVGRDLKRFSVKAQPKREGENRGKLYAKEAAGI